MGLFRKIFGSNKSDDDTNALVKSSQMLDDEDLYWQIINGSLVNSNTQDDQQEYLTKRLQNLTPTEIIGFKLRTRQIAF